jgi:hypothetical protein
MAKRLTIRFGYEKIPGKAKRWRDLNDPNHTISDRAMADLSRQVRLGEKISKEHFHKGVIEGKYRYKNPEQTQNAVLSRQIRKEIPGIADNPDDVAVVLKFRANGGKAGGAFDELTDEEQARFRELFEDGPDGRPRYDHDQVRKALGSPKRRRDRARRRPSDRRRDRARTPRPKRKRASKKRA